MFKRCSGVLLPVFSLPSRHGIGDIGPAAHDWIQQLATAGQTWWQILPLNPGNKENSYSPYFSSSAFAANPLLISLEQICALDLLDEKDLAEAPFFEADKIQYEAVRNWKMPLLKKAWQSFIESADSTLQADFQHYCQQESDWLLDYALFEICQQKFAGASWSDWPTQLRDRHPDAIQELQHTQSDAVAFIQFCQFIFHQQWGELLDKAHSVGLQLVGDMPIYVSYESADVWSKTHLFQLDPNGKPTAVSGVPPDYFSSTGQLWNNPVYDWQTHATDQFSWWCRRMQALLQLYDIVRIDHFRGLVQYWAVPANSSTAINGSWQDVPTDDLLDALEKSVDTFAVIAEDLGTITEDVKAVMSQRQYPGMKILQFAFGTNNPQHPYLPHNYERNCLVYTGTHDNNTSLGWLQHECTPAERTNLCQYLGLPDATTDHVIVKSMIRLAMASIADVTVIPVQDLLGLDQCARINNPAQVENNWHWRCRLDMLEQIDWAWLADLTGRYARQLEHEG
ncbi:MAG: 4-alpha-glucanotransferase [Leptospiraceae bacterium]|nr:4-alpha-glucanotransferase [Leptospiraceae bacterium]